MSKGTVHVQAKTSTVAWVVGAFIVIALMGSLGSLSGMAVQGAGAVADEAMPCDPYNYEFICPAGKQGGTNGMGRGTTATTSEGMPRVSDEEMAQRQAAKALGDSLPPIAAPVPVGPPTDIPTLANPGMGGGILSEVPVIGGALEAGGTALGMGMKAIGR